MYLILVDDKPFFTFFGFHHLPEQFYIDRRQKIITTTSEAICENCWSWCGCYNDTFPDLYYRFLSDISWSKFSVFSFIKNDWICGSVKRSS